MTFHSVATEDGLALAARIARKEVSVREATDAAIGALRWNRFGFTKPSTA